MPALQVLVCGGQSVLETPAAEKVPDAQSAMVASPVAEQADVMRLPALVCVQDTHTLPLEYVPVAPPVQAEQAPLLQP